MVRGSPGVIGSENGRKSLSDPPLTIRTSTSEANRWIEAKRQHAELLDEGSRRGTALPRSMKLRDQLTVTTDRHALGRGDLAKRVWRPLTPAQGAMALDL